MCFDKLNKSAADIKDVATSFTNLSSAHNDLREQISSNSIALIHHSSAIAEFNRSQNALLAKTRTINGSIVWLSDSVSRLHQLHEL